MMNSIISSSEPAEFLNKKVADKVAKHLFLFCNYNPESIVALSDDAKFLKGILNLYKAMYDVGIFDKSDSFGRRYLKHDSDGISKIMRLIHAMRTLIAHNEDFYNAGEENKECVEQWFLEVIGKKQPECLEEYAKPVHELTKIGDEYVKIIDKFVEEVSKQNNKEDIIKEWEKLIFKFYKRPNSKSIFKGNLKKAYLSHNGSIRIFKSYGIAKWVERMILFDEQSKIELLYDVASKGKVPPKNLKDICEKIEEYKKELYDKKKRIAEKNNKEVDDLNPFDYLDYYVAMFPQRIVDEFGKGGCDSLLPQDIVQLIIEKDFSKL